MRQGGNGRCLFTHAWGPWREGRATRQVDGAVASAIGRECLRCGQIQYKPA